MQPFGPTSLILCMNSRSRGTYSLTTVLAYTSILPGHQGRIELQLKNGTLENKLKCEEKNEFMI